MNHLQPYQEFISTPKNFLTEGVNVDPSKYIRVHGKAPKGTGIWAFEIDGEAMLTPRPMSYSDAQKWAKEKAGEKKAKTIYTLG
jgi:hypothetical protein